MCCLAVRVCISFIPDWVVFRSNGPAKESNLLGGGIQSPRNTSRGGIWVDMCHVLQLKDVHRSGQWTSQGRDFARDQIVNQLMHNDPLARHLA